MNEGVLQAGIVVTLMDMLEQGFDRRKYVFSNDVCYLIYFSLVTPNKVLSVLVVTRLDFVHTHLQQIAICSKVI
jgi:hypothetical protein